MPTEPTIHLLAFGIVAEKAGASRLRITGATDTAQLLEALYQQHPALRELRFAIAVNRKIVHENTPLQADSEVALLPPFSGG